MPSPATAPAGFVRSRLFVSSTITEIEQVTPHMRRIRLAGPRLEGLSWIPGQQIRVEVTDFGAAIRRLRPNEAVRTYSIFDGDPVAGSLDLVVAQHEGGDGPGAAWARAAAVGDAVWFMRPQGDFTAVAGAACHLFAGEETASVAFAAILRSLPAAATVHGVVEAATAADHLPLPRPLTRIERGTASAVRSQPLVDAVRALDLPATPGVAYLAGEARTIQEVRRHLVGDRGWNRRDVRTKPFWTPGRRGME
ncbi:siderophore-interacting protein [Pseudonocardia sp. GCM10023141]|uniref:siderophore-interacting protein n=1 Tax=Pseudonocardia sp. GCM10023141 TaxID=3252653 RepID=UPI003620ACC4